MDRDGRPRTRSFASNGPVSMVCGGERRITASSSAARRLGQRSTHSRASRQASHAPTFRTPAGSAAASCYAAFIARPLADAQRSITLRLPLRLIAARRRLTPQASRDSPRRHTSKHDGPPGHALPQSLSGKTP